MSKLKTIKTGKLISVCPGKRHAWFESKIGKIRRPVSVRYDAEKGEDIVTVK